MANITVSYADIERSATHLGAGREEITQQLQSLQQHISGLVASGFVTDQASVKFNDAYSQYTVSAKSVIDRLTEIQTFLVQSAAALRDMDAQIAARIS